MNSCDTSSLAWHLELSWQAQKGITHNVGQIKGTQFHTIYDTYEFVVEKGIIIKILELD
jgi:hypothetical protein